MPCFPVLGDLQLTADGKGFVMATGVARLVQRIRIGLTTLLGTWRWDTTVGVPLTGIPKLTLNVLKAMLRRYLLSYPEIARVTSLTVTLDHSTGLATVNYAAITKASTALQDSVPFSVVAR